jgi:hypothetical protein
MSRNIQVKLTEKLDFLNFRRALQTDGVLFLPFPTDPPPAQSYHTSSVSNVGN